MNDQGEPPPAPPSSDDGREVWCRLETAGPLSTVRRVSVMQANGEILGSWPPDRFEAGLVDQMRSGHIRAFLTSEGGAGRVSFRDPAGREVFSARI